MTQEPITMVSREDDGEPVDWAAVLEGFRAGNMWAIHKVSAVLYGYFLTRGLRGDAQRDAIQESLARLWLYRDSIETVVPYARQVALSVFREWLRSQIGGGDESAIARRVQEADQEERTALKECLDRLDDRARRVFESRFLLEKTREETARDIGVSEPTIGRAAARARYELRRCLESVETIPGRAGAS